MGEEKEEYEVGIPLDDLTSDSVPEKIDSNVNENDDPSVGSPDDEGAGLPSLFDEDELAEVGLKAAPFGDGMEIPVDEDEASHSMESDNDEKELPDISEMDSDDADKDDDVEDPAIASDLQAEVEIDSESVFIEDGPADPIADFAHQAAGEGPEDTGTDALHRQIDAIQAQLNEIKDEFAGKLKYDAHKDQIIDKLHQELQEYKQDIVKKHILSIVLDVVKVADDIRKWLAYFRSLDVSQRDPVKLFRYLEAIPTDLEDIFYWQGVKPYNSREGTFNPAKQRAIKKIPTDDISKDKTIAKSIRPGYEWENKVIRQEMVAVYVYEEDPESVDMRNIDE